MKGMHFTPAMIAKVIGYAEDAANYHDWQAETYDRDGFKEREVLAKDAREFAERLRAQTVEVQS